MTDNKTNINWYPGHMAKAKKEIKESLKLVDVIIELIDARIPYSSKNPDIDELANNKPRVLLVNKADLADDRVTADFKSYYESKGYHVMVTNARNGNLKPVMNVVREACKEKIERDKARGMINRPIRAMILGIPNVGKSTFINSYAKKACTKTGDKPGVTTGKQWIRLSKELELLDTPGILWPKFEDQKVGLNIAMIGSINENILDSHDLSLNLLRFLVQNYPGAVSSRYGVQEKDDPLELLYDICTKKACLKKGGEPDIDRMSFTVTDDFRGGKFGKVSLEKVSDFIK
jgi:ribosome biogenesis GTPase A